MDGDLFRALQDKDNPRGHPILAALLYVHCPAAARWWLAGADPAPPAANGSSAPAGAPFDPVWQALTDLTAGETLKEALTGHGFETLVDDAKQYVDAVDAWRLRHDQLTAPERLPTFPGGRLELSRRYGLQAEIENFDGRWTNFFAYLRAWAFLVPDWERAMRWAAPPERAPVRLALTAPGVRRPAYWPAWGWGSAMGQPRRQVIGLVAPGGVRDQLLLGLARRAGPVGERPWPAPPEVWLLDADSGAAGPADLRLEHEVLPGLLERLAALAKEGPHPPLAALRGAPRCTVCGFRAQCFGAQGALTGLALAESYCV